MSNITNLILFSSEMYPYWTRVEYLVCRPCTIDFKIEEKLIAYFLIGQFKQGALLFKQSLEIPSNDILMTKAVQVMLTHDDLKLYHESHLTKHHVTQTTDQIPMKVVQLFNQSRFSVIPLLICVN